MSAFLSSQTTYDYIASGLYDAAIRYNSEAHYTVRKFLALEDETLEHTIIVAVRQLYDLNRLALVTRYGEQWEREDSFSPAIKHDAIINLAQFVKCIRCVIYQCHEYLTDETDTYKQWRDLAQRLAYSYFEGLPEYAAAEWDMAA